MGTAIKRQKWLILLCWVVYAAAHLGRYSYNSNINRIMMDFSVSHAQAGLVTTCFFFAYGAGQIINGILCKYYPKKYVLSGALVISAALNFVVYFGVGFAAWKYLWLANGVVQSTLWTSLIFTLSENLETQNLKKAVVIISTTTAAGTFAAYGLSALLSVLNIHYRFSFLTGGVTVLAVAVLWGLFYDRVTVKGGIRIAEEESEQTKKKGGNIKALLPMICLLAVFAVVNNLIKDGLNTWVPSILKESYGLSDGLSIFLTLFLPVLSIFGTAVAVAVNKKIKDFILLAALLFMLSAVTILGIIGLLNTSLWILVLLCFAVVSMLMAGINNVVTSMSPLFLRARINSGLLSGIMNGFCYVGSTLSSYGLGRIADSEAGWKGVFGLFLLLSTAVAVAGGIYAVIFAVRKKRQENYKNKEN